MTTSESTERAAISARYRSYCDACQSGHIERVPDFWGLPAVFTIDEGSSSDTSHKLIQTAPELEAFYSTLFGPSTGIDKTSVDAEDIRFFGEKLAVIETTLSHWVKGELHDKMRASYGCRKVDGEWWFVSHISDTENESA